MIFLLDIDAIKLFRYENIWTWLPINFRFKLKKYSAKLNQNNTFKRRIKKLLNGANLNENDRILNYFKWIQREDLQKLYSLEFKNNIKNLQNGSEIENFLNDIPQCRSKLEKC